MIAAFNDYAEDQAVWTAQTDLLTGSDEKWYDLDGLLHPSMYWDMTKDYISKIRGPFTTMPAPTIAALEGDDLVAAAGAVCVAGD